MTRKMSMFAWACVLALGPAGAAVAQEAEPKKDEPKPAPADTPKVDDGAMKTAIDGATRYSSYAFTSTTERAGGFGGGGPEGRGGGRGAGGPMEGQYAKDVGLMIKTGDRQMVKVKDSIAVQNPEDGTWRKLDAAGAGGRGGQGGGRRGGGPDGGPEPRRGGPDGGGERGRGGRGAGGMRGMASLRAPHEELAVLAGGIDKTTASEKDGEATRYAVSLKTQTVLDLSGMGRRFGDSQVEMAGTASFWVDANGKLTRYEYTTTINATMRDQDVEMKTTRKVELKGIDSTTVSIPEEALKALNPPAEPKAEPKADPKAEPKPGESTPL